MKKRILIACLIGVICLGSSQLLPVFASGDAGSSSSQERTVSVPPKDTKVKDSEHKNNIAEDTTKSEATNNLRRPQRSSKEHEDALNNLAKDLDISTEGKDSSKIETEIRSTLLQQKAKEAGIEVEGKSEEEIITELKEEYAEKPEVINPSSNKYEELRMKPESRRNDIVNKAKQYGIETEGKEFDEIVEELKSSILKNKGE
ncbi:hypothetical protein [Bacillus sinesaloumensis]|uniref:hypothetical protein n=1 Tax=Litchfieldia sinesaloumensis TaxID=1926280 RepID=UPI00114DDA74|nr:hypothetical protein [Bacillus sinesaloumensis]